MFRRRTFNAFLYCRRIRVVVDCSEIQKNSSSTFVLTRFFHDQEGRGNVVFPVIFTLLVILAGGSVTFALTDGDPMGAYQRMNTKMYWSARCKENIPGACQMAKIQW